MTITVKIDDAELQRTLAGIVGRCRDMRPVMKGVGGIIRESIRTNFREGGRPLRWKPSKRGTADSIPGRMIGTLRDTNRLMNSFTNNADRDRVSVGTNVEYAATHHFGAKKGSFGAVAAMVRAHLRQSKSGKTSQVKEHQRRMRLPWGDIPARPFMLVQDEDIVDIKEALADYITGEKI